MTSARVRTDEILPGDFFVLRTPLLPVQSLSSLQSGQASDVSGFASFLERHEIKEALQIASPDLCRALLTASTDHNRNRALLALGRYMIRMSRRSTPFGLFAGIAIGRIGNKTSLTVDMADARRFARLDSDLLRQFHAGLCRIQTILARVPFIANTSVRRVGDRLRYVAYEEGPEGRRYELASVPLSAEVVRALDVARDAVLLNVVTSELMTSFDLSQDDASLFVSDMVEAKLLEPVLQPLVTGCDALEDTLHTLSSIIEAAPVYRMLNSIRHSLEQLDSRLVGDDAEALYDSLDKTIRDVGLATSTRLDNAPHRDFLHVELHYDCADLELDSQLSSQALEGVIALRSVMGDRDDLTRFISNFEERFGTGPVELTRALDEDSGIPFGPGVTHLSTLLKGLPFPGTESMEAASASFDLAILEKTIECLRGRSDAVEVELDAAGSARAIASLGSCFAAQCRLEMDTCSKSSQLLIDTVVGAGGTLLLGRHCHGNAKLEACLKRLIAIDEREFPEAIYAELVHLPPGRSGNFVSRPCLRSFEIPFLGRSGKPHSARILVDDLLIFIDSGRIRLWSKKLNRQVIPRMSNAHNPMSTYSPAVYRFLSMLQFQDNPSFSWSWRALGGLPFLPRVISGRCVLSLAQWRLSAKDVTDTDKMTGSDAEQVERLRERSGLPDQITISEGDNELALDLDDPFECRILMDHMKRHGSVVLTETFPSLKALAVSSSQGNRWNEIIIPFHRAVVEQHIVHLPQADLVDKTFDPGSEWLYLKLYAAPAAQDELIERFLLPFGERVVRACLVDQWFFIRYGDPSQHLRVRFHGRPDRLLGQVLPLFRTMTRETHAEPLLEEWQVATYEREVQRYGGVEAAQLAERLFWIDSVAAARLIALEHTAEVPRWLICSCSINGLIDALGLSLPNRCSLMQRLVSRFGGLAGSSDQQKALKHAIAARYRVHKATLRNALSGEGLPRHVRQTIEERDKQIALLAIELVALTRSGLLAVPLETLAESYVHMHVNRLMRSEHAHYEPVLYDFLHREYRSALARAMTDTGRPLRVAND